MRRAEGPRREHGMRRIGETGDAVYRARRDRFVVIQRRHDRGQRASEHRLPRARRADEQQVVAARGRELERLLRRFLAGDVGEIDLVTWDAGPSGDWRGRGALPAFEMRRHVPERAEGERVDPAGRGLARVLERHERGPDPARRGVAHARHRPSDRPQRAVEGQLAETQGRRLHRELGARAQDAKCDREVEARPLLSSLGRCEVHGHAAQRELVARVPDGRAHSLPGLLHGGVGETNDDERGQAVGDVDLDRDERRLESPEGARRHARDRARGPRPLRCGDRDGRTLFRARGRSDGTLGRYRGPNRAD